MPTINIEFPDIRPDMTPEEVKAIVPELVRAKQLLEADLRKLNKALKGLNSDKLLHDEQGQLKAVINMLEKAIDYEPTQEKEL
jgi:hypothetical protein